MEYRKKKKGKKKLENDKKRLKKIVNLKFKI